MSEAKANKRNADVAMAARMKENPGQYPDSVRRPHQGNGAEYRRGHAKRPFWELRTYEKGMLGGILCAHLSMGNHGIPKEFLA